MTSINDNAVANANRAFAYDPNGRLSSATGPWGSEAYGYDGLGNIRTIDKAANDVFLYYDASNRVSAERSGSPTATAIAYTYDARGNTLSDYARTYVYDFANQPTRAATAAVTADFVYDGNYKRVKGVWQGKTSYTFYSQREGGMTFRHQTTDSVKTDYIALPGGAPPRNAHAFLGSCVIAHTPRGRGVCAGRFANNVIRYTYADHLGSPVVGTSATGAVEWRETYRPFGLEMNFAAGNDNQPGFTGHLEDDRLDLVYMQARFYNPVTGRFLSTDPIGYEDQLNLYAYVANDPVNKTDPTGMFSNCADDPTCHTVHCDGCGYSKPEGGSRTLQSFQHPDQKFRSDVERLAGPVETLDDALAAQIAADAKWVKDHPYEVISVASMIVIPLRAPATVARAGARATTDFVATRNGLVNVRSTIDRIKAGDKFPHRNDGSVFQNREGLLPKQRQGFYREYVHPTPGVNGPGAQRIIQGQNGELYYSPDHYRTFVPLN